jgi:hypothetical protein
LIDWWNAPRRNQHWNRPFPMLCQRPDNRQMQASAEMT